MGMVAPAAAPPGGSVHGIDENLPVPETGAGANTALVPPPPAPPAGQSVAPPIPEEIAKRFIEALRLEYIEDIRGSVGAFFEETFGQESGTVGASDVGQFLEKEKEKVRDADNRKEAIESLKEYLARSSLHSSTIAPSCPTMARRGISSRECNFD